MCGGEYTSWSEPRQLIEYKGETLVGRTIRLLREQGVDDIAISRFIKHHKENPAARLAACKVLSEHWCSKTYAGIIGQ